MLCSMANYVMYLKCGAVLGMYSMAGCNPRRSHSVQCKAAVSCWTLIAVCSTPINKYNIWNALHCVNQHNPSYTYWAWVASLKTILCLARHIPSMEDGLDVLIRWSRRAYKMASLKLCVVRPYPIFIHTVAGINIVPATNKRDNK